MQKEVFIGEHLDNYRYDEKIVKSLEGRVLLNHDEFVKWYSPPKIRMSERNLTKKINRQPSVEKVETISNAILELMAEGVCEKKIGRTYGIDAVRRLVNSQFDILVLVESNYLDIKAKEGFTYTKTAANKKMNHVLGFIIVEKGECQRLPNAYSVNLICVRSIKDKPRGSVLLGAYLYCCKKIGQRYGLLELAGGYRNVAGFFAYSKMGFIKNTTLFDKRCFKDYGNLPMSIDLADYRYTEFVDYASGHRKFTNFRDDTGFINIIPEKGNVVQHELQNEIARYCNLLYQMPFIFDGYYKTSHWLDEKIIEDMFESYDNPSLDNCIDYLYESIEDLSRTFHEAKYPQEIQEEEERQVAVPSKGPVTLKQLLSKYKSTSSKNKTNKTKKIKSKPIISRRKRGPENTYVGTNHSA
uniref:Uncharacterized protein n=1 Tax=viral metagenome TaxID=1070528 RepID=A0A6C0B7K4_9ZZZZ